MGTLFGGVYTLGEKIGQGGMAEVYRARVDLDAFDYTTLFAYTQVQGENHTERRELANQVSERLRDKALDSATMRALLEAKGVPVPGHVVAVKVGNSADCRARLEAEWIELLCLKHPNLIEVYGGGIHEGQPYYAMELVKKIVTPETIRNRFTIRQKLNVLINAGKGLQHLHEKGIVHRDVKPDNILTWETAPGEYCTKLTDLGLAKNLAENLGLTQTDIIIGSPVYMAPEQMQDSSDVDNRADIYSMGVTLYELVTGVLPHHDRTQAYQLLIAVSTGVLPIPPNEHVPHLPAAVTAIIETAMAPKRAERYPSIADMIADIEQYLGEEDERYTAALSFREACKLKSSTTVGKGRYAFEEILRAQQPDSPLLLPEEEEELPEDIDVLQLMAMNRRPSAHGMFERVTSGIHMGYVAANDPGDAITKLEYAGVDIAVVEYLRRDALTLRLCEQLKRNHVPYLLHGNNLDRTDILLAARLGATAVMQNPLGENQFREKLLKLLATAGKSVTVKKEVADQVDFKGRKTPQEKARIVVKRAPELLVLPHAASRTISLCSDPNATASDLAKTIQSDSAIAAMVLRRANSALLAGTQRITTVRDAVVRIGRRETKKMAVAMTAYKLFDRQEKTFGFNRYLYWVHALSTGIASQAIAEHAAGTNSQDAFLGGLLHDIGKIIFDDHMNQEYQTVVQRVIAEGARMVDVEQATFMMEHTFMGARVGEKWRLPEAVLSAVEGHHNRLPETEGKTPRTLDPACLVQLGNNIAKAMGLGHAGDVIVDDIPMPYWRAALGGVGRVPRFCDRVTREIRSFVDLLGMDPVQAQLSAEEEQVGLAVGIVPDGLGALLHFFFCARGWSVQTLDWDQVLASKTDLALDMRFIPDDIRTAFYTHDFRHRRVFLLGGDKDEFRNTCMHCIEPAHDFFRLETCLREISRTDA